MARIVTWRAGLLALLVLTHGTTAHEPHCDASSGGGEPNPPHWGENVIVVEPGKFSEELSKQLGEIHRLGAGWANDAQFGDRRTAVLLMPGTHEVDIELPYYFQVLGLGGQPGDTIVNRGPRGIGLKVGIPMEADGTLRENSCNTFWRSIENLRMTWDTVAFYVSQAAPLRSIIVDGDLELDAGAPYWSSGGCLANSQVDGNIILATQQQWYTKSTQMRRYPHPAGVGSYVCVGCTTPSGHPHEVSYDFLQQSESMHRGESYTEAPEVSAQKPYVMMEDGKYFLRIPEVSYGRWGPDWKSGRKVPFEQVFVAQPGVSAEQINSKILSGLHVVFSPGIYRLEQPIRVDVSGAVLLGLGFATLIPTFGPEPIVQIGDVPGVRVAGLLLQAGGEALRSGALLQWGTPGHFPGSREQPGFIHDLIARAGGPDQEAVAADYFVQINSGWVVGDNLWLWKADHCVENVDDAYCVYPIHVGTALEVNGDNVHMYGLMAEHTDREVVIWNGEGGRTYFYQSEFRYTPGLKTDLSLSNGWVGDHANYRVNARVHRGVGFGIYAVILPSLSSRMLRLKADCPMEDGFKAVVVQHVDTWQYGFKDVHGLNWDTLTGQPTWPSESRIAWQAFDGARGVGLLAARTA